MHDTRPLLLDSDFPPIKRGELTTLQVNLGYLCNLSCTHCHVNAGPNRSELMNAETIELVLKVLTERKVKILDLTGGSPEMNPLFRYLVKEARQLGVEVMDRCNPTILGEPGYEDLADFFAAQQVIIVASLPCYMEQRVDKQRGRGVYEESIHALQQLNGVGYGKPGSGLSLNLVYNPDDAVLPPSQIELEQDYKQELKSRWGIEFNQLYTIANMPISRFGSYLISKGKFQEYLDVLKNAYMVDNLSTVMCRSLISVDYQGYLYDCDFNQALKLPLLAVDHDRPHLSHLLTDAYNQNGKIAVGEHCYGCTAGQGSSCGGALS